MALFGSEHKHLHQLIIIKFKIKPEVCKVLDREHRKYIGPSKKRHSCNSLRVDLMRPTNPQAVGKIRGYCISVVRCRQNLKTVTSKRQNRDMRRFSVLVFGSCLALSLCSGFSRVSSVPSLTNHSDFANRKENCQKVSETPTYVSFKF